MFHRGKQLAHSSEQLGAELGLNLKSSDLFPPHFPSAISHRVPTKVGGRGNSSLTPKACSHDGLVRWDSLPRSLKPNDQLKNTTDCPALTRQNV